MKEIIKLIVSGLSGLLVGLIAMRIGRNIETASILGIVTLGIVITRIDIEELKKSLK